MQLKRKGPMHKEIWWNFAGWRPLGEHSLHKAGDQREFADRNTIHRKKSHGNGGAVEIDGAPLKLPAVEMLKVIQNICHRG